MKLSASHLKRYKEIAQLLWKYGRADLAQQMSADGESFSVADIKPVGPGEASPEHLADDLEAMGPTFVKLGQVLAGRPDLLPDPYLKALARLQDQVKPFPTEDVEHIVMTELGVRLSKAFTYFDPEPIAAASLGQVHAALLRDGRPVVVKVQRPGIRKQIAEDFEVLEQIAGFFDAHTDVGRRYRFGSVLEEFRQTIHQELNYEREAQNLIAVGANLQDFPAIVIPQPVSDYSTRCVLTMDRIEGRKITKLGGIARLELKGGPLAEELFRAYLKQVLIDGLFHADPHPGNVFVTADGRIALLDLGMVGRTTPTMQENLLKLLLAISTGNGDVAAEIVIHMSEKTEEFDPVAFSREIGQLVAQHQDQGLSQLNVGRTLLALSRHATENGLFVASELTLLGKTMLQLDEVGRILDPTFDAAASVRRNVEALMTQRLRKDFTKSNVVVAALEMKGFMSHLPLRLNRIMDAVSSSELEVRVKAVDAKMVMTGMQKIANRITTGLVLAALIIGASLLMRIDTPYRLFGYPTLAILCFIAAAGGAIWLLIAILLQDRKDSEKR